MTVQQEKPNNFPTREDDLLYRHIAGGLRVHHVLLSFLFLLLIALGAYFIITANAELSRTAVSSYQATELEIVRDASRSTREYVYVQTVVLNRTDISTIEQEVLKKFIAPIHLLQEGDAWIYAPDHVVFDLSSDFPDEYRNKSMAAIFAIQVKNGASHYEAMTSDVMQGREGTGYYVWLPEKGEEIAAWTPVTVNNYTWTIGLSTPLPEILDATGATARTRTTAYIFVAGVSIAMFFFIALLYMDVRRWKYEEILHESEDRYAAIVNNTPVPVLTLQEDRIMFLNDAGIEASGYPREEIIGKDLLPFLTDDSRKATLEAKNRRAGGREQISEYEVTFTRKDGGLVQLIVRAIDITYKGEEITLALLVDITERKRADMALRMASRKLSLLSSITRHDINNQLQALSGYIQLSGAAINNPDKIRELLDKEALVAENIGRQISFTRDYEDLGVKSPSWQDVGMVARSAAAALPMQNIRLGVQVPPLEIYADPLLEKVFYNLIDNSLRYGGEALTSIKVMSCEENGGLILAVEDDGCGIAVEDKDRLFTKGFGRHTGLGLFLSREILAITGITIRETGEPGKGARFEIRVPAGEWRIPDSDNNGKITGVLP